MIRHSILCLRAWTDLGFHYEFSICNPETDTLVTTIPDPNQVPTPSWAWTPGPLEQVLHLGRNYYDVMFADPVIANGAAFILAVSIP